MTDKRSIDFAPALGVEVYEAGFQGVYSDPVEYENLINDIQDAGGQAFASDACRLFGIEETGKGKLALLFPAVLKRYPDSVPGGAQQRGDCVSWTCRSALLHSYCQEVEKGKPDPHTGRHEELPDVSDTARKNGVISTEAIYWFRRHGGDGWNGSAAARVALRECGLVLRQDYPALGVNLETYSPNTAGKWGSTPPSGSVAEMCRQHLARTATVVDSYEHLRDLIAAGYGVMTTGSEAYSRTRDEWGRCSRTAGSWAHAIAATGVDDRPETIRKWGEGLVHLTNSWGEYMTGPRKVWGTDVEIPRGTFWVKWSDMKNRHCIALSDCNGWPRKKAKDWGAREIL